MEDNSILIYNTGDGKSSVSLYAKDGGVWMNQNQLAELFATSKQNISLHIVNILKEKELDENSVVKYYLTTAADGKNYNSDTPYYSFLLFSKIRALFILNTRINSDIKTGIML